MGEIPSRVSGSPTAFQRCDAVPQELTISLLRHSASKLPNVLEWSSRYVDYRALIATNWDPLVKALSNWEARGEHDEARTRIVSV